jgi:hypothetical protein
LHHHLSFQFEYSPREHVLALDETPYRRMVKKWWIPGSVVFVTLPFAWHIFRNDFNARSPNALLWLGAVGFLPMLVTMLATPLVIRRLEMARYRRARTGNAGALEARHFGTEGIARGDGAPPIPWSMITRVIESENFYLFYDALSDIPDYLPKRVLAPSDTKSLQALLQTQFHSRNRDLQLLARAT